MKIRSKSLLPKQSDFICLCCMNRNKIGSGIHRGRQRPKYHIKSLYCLDCQEVTYNIEIRYCDWFPEIYEKGLILREEYYKNTEKIENEVNFAM